MPVCQSVGAALYQPWYVYVVWRLQISRSPLRAAAAAASGSSFWQEQRAHSVTLWTCLDCMV
jgi:hypothetical protein